MARGRPAKSEIRQNIVEILYFINDLDDRATIAEIAKCMSIHTNTIARQIKKLESSGLVKKQKCRSNKKLVIYSVTEKGEVTFAHALKYESIHVAMSLLTNLDCHQFGLYLNKLLPVGHPPYIHLLNLEWLMH